MSDELPRQYGPWFAGALVAASMVGVGILVTPFFAVKAAGSLWGSSFLWLFGGFYSLCGALMLASVATARPKSGGEYLYVEEAFGPAAGYLYGWATLLLGFAAPIAAVALAATRFLMQALAFDLAVPDLSGCVWCTPLAALLILALGAWHCLGPMASSRMQIAATAVKLGLLALVVVGLAVLALRDVPGLLGRLNQDFNDAYSGFSGWEQKLGVVGQNFRNVPAGAALMGSLELFAPLLGSMAFVVFTYTGWNAAAYVAGEIRDPARNLPRALVGGCAAVTLFYLLAVFGLAARFPAAGILMENDAFLERMASRSFEKSFGGDWVWACNLVVGLGMLATVSAFLVTGARVMFAMARSGHFPAFAGGWQARQGAPVAALVTLAAASAALACFGTVRTLLEAVGGGLAATGVVLGAAALRLRRLPGYAPAFVPMLDPLPTWLFTIFSGLIAAGAALSDGVKAAWGLLAIVAALPIYAATARLEAKPEPPP